MNSIMLNMKQKALPLAMSGVKKNLLFSWKQQAKRSVMGQNLKPS